MRAGDSVLDCLSGGGGSVTHFRIPEHTLLCRIGAGSYGEVWLARNCLGTYRAVKIVRRSEFAHQRPYERELRGIQRFEPVSRLHEGLIDVLSVGQNEEAALFYYIMELADDAINGVHIQPATYTACTLDQVLAARQRLPAHECVGIGLRLTSALDFLHQNGLTHRDIKPSNIVFINGLPKLADIGLVTDLGEARSYVGTDGYIPPEGPGTVQADNTSSMFLRSSLSAEHLWPKYFNQNVIHEKPFQFASGAGQQSSNWGHWCPGACGR